MKILIALLVLTTALYGQEEEAVPIPETQLEDSIHSLVHGTNSFAYTLYNQLRGQPGNLFFSPYSVASALAIPYIGARAGTQSQMQATLHFLPREENLYLAFAELNRRFTKAWMQGPNEVRLMMANALWVQNTFRLENDFLDKAKRYFGATIKPADFIRNADAARLNMNEWVREATHGRISSIVDKGDLTANTRLALISSIFMKAVWQHPFESSVTTQTPFFIDPKSTISVPMMTETKFLRVYQQPQFTLLELPYSISPVLSPMASAQFDMLIVLPTAIGGIAQMENRVASGELDDWLGNLKSTQVIVSLPRFKFTSSLDLVPALKQMGMPVAFSPMADFTGIFAGGGLSLDKVLHKAYIAVDEKGTEAVAATAVSISVTSVLQENPPLVFKADHPFVFVIIERTTGTMLFMGRFSVPTH